jgi:hypothetical protein
LPVALLASHCYLGSERQAGDCYSPDFVQAAASLAADYLPAVLLPASHCYSGSEQQAADCY